MLWSANGRGKLDSGASAAGAGGLPLDGVATAIVALPRALAIAEQGWGRAKVMPRFDHALLRLGEARGGAPAEWIAQWRTALDEQRSKLIAAFPWMIPSFASTLIDIGIDEAMPLFDASKGAALSIRGQAADRLMVCCDRWIEENIGAAAWIRPSMNELVLDERARRAAAIVKSPAFDPRLALPVICEHGQFAHVHSLNLLLYNENEWTRRVASRVESLDEVMKELRDMWDNRTEFALPVDWSKDHVQVLRFAESTAGDEAACEMFAQFVERHPELLIDYNLVDLEYFARGVGTHARVERAVHRALDLHPSYAWAPMFTSNSFRMAKSERALARVERDKWVERECGNGAFASLRGARGRMVALLAP